MTARLTRLRIAGFKSFAEPASLDIMPGLTGIVGPNGCGKSNVIEALRWAMGESSARSLRGGDMDDVIFAGTTARASRNLAEVTVTLEPGTLALGVDAPGTALPSPFESDGELQVTRRIERGAGSTFRANGRELRARDVQTLYADLASGARSSGMVSQGRVADLVRARPEERRRVLEEAAGITGLHARRHEAELKLRAAEQNLRQSDDLRAQLDTGRDGLRRQASQAARYRAISGLIRLAQADHLAVLHGRAAARLDTAKADLAQAAEAAEAAMRAHQAASEALEAGQTALAEPRRLEAHARSVLERRRVEAETLTAEAARLRRDAAAAETRLRELEVDLAACDRTCADGRATVMRLSGERDLAAAQLAALPAELAQACALADAALAQRAAAQLAHDSVAGEAASRAAAARQAGETLREAAGRVLTARARHEAALTELAACAASRIDQAALDAAETASAAGRSAMDAARRGLEQAELARDAAAAAEAEAQARMVHERIARDAAERSAMAARSRVAQAEATCREAARARNALLADRPAEQDIQAARLAAEAAEASLAAAELRIVAAERCAAEADGLAAQMLRQAEAATHARTRAVADAADAAMRAQRLVDERAGASAEREAVALSSPASDAWASAEAAREAAARHAAACDDVLCHDDIVLQGAVQAAATARSVSAGMERQVARLDAESDGLAAALGCASTQDEALAALHVPSWLEAAVGAALGDAGGASLDRHAARYWRSLPAMDPAPLPAGCTALAPLVGALPALCRALSYAALLDEGADGDAVQPCLAAGMVLVDRAGASWRWDGLVTRQDAPNPAAAAMARRRRMQVALAELATAREAARAAREVVVAAEAAEAEAAASAERAGSACRRAREEERAASWLAGDVRAAWDRAALRLAELDRTVSRLEAEAGAASRDAADAQAALCALPCQDALGAALRAAAAEASLQADALQAARAQRQSARDAAVSTYRLAQEVAGSAARFAALIDVAEPALARALAERDAAMEEVARVDAALAVLPCPERRRAELEGLAAATTACQTAEALARELRQEKERVLDQALQHESQLRLSQARAETGFAVLSGQSSHCEADLASAEASEAEAARLASALPDAAALVSVAEQARRHLGACEAAAREAEQRVVVHQADRAHTERAVAGLSAELATWQGRLVEAEQRCAALQARHDAAQSAWSDLASWPQDMEARAASSCRALAEAEAAQADAAARVAQGEASVRASAIAEREASHWADTARERHMLGGAAIEAADGALQAVVARAADRLGCGFTLPDVSDVSDVSEAAENRAHGKLERLSRERDGMGPVNLRAELELDELETRIGALEAEQAELGTAIARLRGAIGHLNREGRERLSAVFTQVDQHFRALFTRMMGGGRAHLALTGSADPLEAGLEIYAEPPGKKLSALSLLSGGEQALTALSLIFAVFRCTPAPLCVLDEVDAPLDDANVDRFCTLLEDMAQETGTSFLVVTHHQLTMSRMDRLYGVTMQERGVSRLLSVDFSRAAEMVTPMLQAAE